MSSRRLLITTCLFALCASPALPQTTTAQRSNASSPSASQRAQAPSLRDVLRAWGLERPTRDTQFRKGEVTRERATFSAMVIKNDDGSNATIDNLVITRSNVPGPTLGQFTITADKFDDGDGTRVTRMSMSGLRGGTNIMEAFKAASDIANQRSRPNAKAATTAPAFVDLISLSDVLTTVTDKDETYSVRAAQFDITNVSFNEQLLGFDVVSVKDTSFDFKDYTVKLASAQLSGVPAELLTDLAKSDEATVTPFDVMTLALGHMSLNGLSYTFKGSNNKPSPVSSVTVDSFSLDDIKSGFIGKFTLAGLKVNGGVGARAFEAGLDRFELGDLNMRYFTELGAATRAAFLGLGAAKADIPPVSDPQAPKVTSSTVPPPTVSTVSTSATTPPAATSPAVTPTPSTPPRQPILLRDMLKGGPLDSGVSGFNMAGLRVSAAGFGFTIDRSGLTQVTDRNGIVVRADIIPTTMRFSWPTQGGTGLGSLAGVFTALGTDNLTIRFSGGATFAPETDRLTFDNYETEVVNWGKIRLDFAMTGLNKLFSEVSLDDIYKASMPPTGTTPATAVSKQLQQVFSLYKSVSINSARAELTDLGGIDLAARISGAMNPRQGTADTPLTADQKRTIRDGWASQFRNTSGDKSMPAIERQFSIALARWLETGGSFVVEANPPSALALPALIDGPKMSQTVLGLRITNRPPGAPAIH